MIRRLLALLRPPRPDPLTALRAAAEPKGWCWIAYVSACGDRRVPTFVVTLTRTVAGKVERQPFVRPSPEAAFLAATQWLIGQDA